MPDKDIKKGLHCCLSDRFTNCKGCPYMNRKDKRCDQALYDDVIGLINRQQEQIKRLTYFQHADLVEAIFTETVNKQTVIKDFVKELKKITVPIMIGNHCRKVISEQGIDTIAERMGVTK